MQVGRYEMMGGEPGRLAQVRARGGPALLRGI